MNRAATPVRRLPGNAKAPWIGSWSDPIVRRVADRDELIMTFPHRVCAFNPSTGKELWTCSGFNELVYTSPLFSQGTVVAMGGFNGMALAVQAGGSGDVTARRLWHHPKTSQRIGSGVIYERAHLHPERSRNRRVLRAVDRQDDLGGTPQRTRSHRTELVVDWSSARETVTR